MLSAYFDQFNIIRIISSGDWPISGTNSSLMIVLVICLMLLLFRGNRLIPNRWQLVMELIHNNIRLLVHDNLGKTGQKYFPLVFCIFLFIVAINIMGLFPYVFTPTSHIVVTFGMSLSIMIAVTILGVLTFRSLFFSILVPRGVPLVLAPPLVIIETLSYIIRAISLGVRLFANISAGHLLFAIISGFAFNLLFSGLLALGAFPLCIMVFITLLELMVAVIQAYVFSLLVVIYFGDTISLH